MLFLDNRKPHSAWFQHQLYRGFGKAVLPSGARMCLGWWFPLCLN